MPGLSPAPALALTVRRAFASSRLHGQLLALAYERLPPIIRSPRRPTRAVGPAGSPGQLSGQPSFQEEEDRDSR